MELSSENIAGLRTIFFALLTGQLIFVLTVIYLLKDRVEKPTYLLGERTHLLAIGAYALAMIFFSRFIDNMWKRQIPTVKRVQRPAFPHYRTNVIFRLATLEGASLLTIVVTLVTGNPMFLTGTAILVAAFWVAQPTQSEFTERYG